MTTSPAPQRAEGSQDHAGGRAARTVLGSDRPDLQGRRPSLRGGAPKRTGEQPGFLVHWAIESAVARCLTPGLFAFKSLAIVPFPTISFSKPFQSRAEHRLQARAPWPYPWSSFPNPERCSTGTDR